MGLTSTSTFPALRSGLVSPGIQGNITTLITFKTRTAKKNVVKKDEKTLLTELDKKIIELSKKYPERAKLANKLITLSEKAERKEDKKEIDLLKEFLKERHE